MDYAKLGLKCGIEIHQQLSGRKLFCRCPAKINDGEPDLVVRRKLHAVVGEMGLIDTAAAQEQARDKAFIYHAYSDCNCLIDLDEEPPQPMDRDQLMTAMLVAKMIHAEPVDEIQVMRKTVIDGSNTTGFQRTALVATDGHIDISQGRIGIPTVCIEEEAAKIVKRGDEADIYNISRLGIPLIELGTAPDLQSPEAVREAAERIGLLLRSTNRVMRGLGTIRQDVNVSIRGGARIEIKGAQDLKNLSKLVEVEAERQYRLIQLKESLGRQDIDGKIHDLTESFRNTESAIIRKAPMVLGIRLPGFKGITGMELAPGRRVGSELADYARVMAGVGGIFHADELPNYGITEKEVEDVRRLLSLKEKDGFVLVADRRDRAEKALAAVVMRAKMLFDGIPSEVRKANPDGTSSYMRPIPGEARMYPETDVMPIKPETGDLEIPELIEDAAQRLSQEYSLSKDLALLIAKSGKAGMFQLFTQEFTALKPAFIAESIASLPQIVRRQYKIEAEPTQDQLETLLSAINQGKLPKESLQDAMADILKGQYDESKYAMDDTALETDIREIVEKNKGAPFAALMGEVMKKYRGKADGRKVSEILKRLS